MRRKIYNNRERHQYISDNTGLHIFQGEAGYVDGIYEVVEDATTLVMALETTSNLNGTNYLMVYGTGTPAENGAELLAAYEAAKQMPRYLGMLTDGPTHNFYVGQIYLHGTGAPSIRRIKANYTGGTQSIPASAYDIIDTVGNAFKYEKFSTTLIVAPGRYEYSANALNLNATNIHIKSLTGEIDVVLSDLAISVSNTFVSGIEVVSTGFININPIITPSLSMCKGFFNGEDGVLLGNFYRCNFVNCGFSEIQATIIDCTGYLNNPDTFEGTAINCRLTGANSRFGTPTGAGKIYNCIDGNGNLINYPAPSYSGMSDNITRLNIENTPTITDFISEIDAVTSRKPGSYKLNLLEAPFGSGTYLNTSLLIYGNHGIITIDNSSTYIIDFESQGFNPLFTNA